MTTSLRPVAQQVMVITGASSGIGLVTARMAAERGARLVLAARNEEALRSLVAEIGGKSGHAVHVVADVGREEDVAAIMKRYAYTSQLADRPSQPREDSALHHAGYGLHERGTHKGWVRSRSYWVKATTHPVLTSAAVVGAGTAWMLARRGDRRHA